MGMVRVMVRVEGGSAYAPCPRKLGAMAMVMGMGMMRVEGEGEGGE